MNILRVITLVAMLFIADTAFGINHRAHISTQLAMVLIDMPDIVVVPNDKSPNEDPSKCPCGGSGNIVHGDGHSTPCPYHSRGENTAEEAPPAVDLIEPKEDTPDFGDEVPPSNDDIDAWEEVNTTEVNRVIKTTDTDWNPIKGFTKQKNKIKETYSMPVMPESEMDDSNGLPESFIETSMGNTTDYEYIIYCFSGKNCAPCNKMWNEVWTDEEVQESLEDHKVNFYKLMDNNPAHRKYFKFYKIDYIPQIIYVKRGDLNTVISRTGYADKQTTLNLIDEVAK